MLISPGHAVARLLILDQPPECYGTWFESDQLPWSDAHPDRRAFVVFRDYPGGKRAGCYVGPTSDLHLEPQRSATLAAAGAPAFCLVLLSHKATGRSA